MFSYQLECPKCHHTFQYSLLKFQTNRICESCQERMLVEVKLAPLLSTAVISITFAQVYLMFLRKSNISENFLAYLFLFISLYALFLIAIDIMIKIFGVHRIFRVSMFQPIKKKSA